MPPERGSSHSRLSRAKAASVTWEPRLHTAPVAGRVHWLQPPVDTANCGPRASKLLVQFCWRFLNFSPFLAVPRPPAGRVSASD